MLFIWLYKGNIKISNGTIITNNTHTNKKFLNLKLYAVLSDYHYFVMKKVNNNKTFTEIKVLLKEEKEIEISKMLSGDEVTEATLNNVREMIKLSDLKKIEIKNK